jgi:hypothetical protein
VTGAGSLLATAALALAALLAARAFVGAFGCNLLRRLDPAGAAGSLVLGGALLTLASVGLSGIGLPAPDTLRLLPALALVPLYVAWRRRRLEVFRPVGARRDWAALGLPACLCALVAHLPVLLTDGFSIGNDTYTYSAFSAWLQGHGFSETCALDPFSPATGIPWLWQSQHYDLGIAHLLALVQAAAGAPLAVLAYPATAAFGMVSVTAAIFLVARQSLRLPTAGAGAVALVFAVVPHALYWGHHNGFLQQTYALGVVLLGTVLLTRALRPRRLRLADGLPVSIPFVFLLVVYLPLLPTLGLAAAATLARAALRARRAGGSGRLAAFVGVVGAAFLLLGLRDLVGVVLRLHNFMTDAAGGHVPYGPLEFFQFGLGARILAPGWSSVELVPATSLNRLLAPVVLALALLGAALSLRRAASRALGAVFVLLLLAIGHYAVFALDPWTHTRGHTWNVFKLCQWALPFLLLVAALGVKTVARHAGKAGSAVMTAAVLVPLSVAPAHWPWSRSLGLTMREILPDGAPLRNLPGLKRRLLELPAGTLLVVGRPANANRWLAAYTGLLAYPRAIVGDWVDSASVSNHPLYGEALYAQALARRDDVRFVPLAASLAPFGEPSAEPLGFGYARLPQPVALTLVHVVNPAGIRRDDRTGSASFAIGEGRTKLVVLAPRPLRAELTLRLAPYRGRPGTRLLAYVADEDYSHRSVRLAAGEGPAAVVPLGGDTAPVVPLELTEGLATVVLVLDEGRGELDAREPITVTALSLVAFAPGR